MLHVSAFIFGDETVEVSERMRLLVAKDINLSLGLDEMKFEFCL
jgi:hypothetical protein